MDDSWFEQAVAELTNDKHHLIAGFAGWMKYDTPQIKGNIVSYIAKDPLSFFSKSSHKLEESYNKKSSWNISLKIPKSLFLRWFSFLK